MSTRADWRVVYDAQALQSEAHKDRGIGRYVRGHVSALHALGAIDRLVCNPTQPPPESDALPTTLDFDWNVPRVIRELAADGPVLYQIPSPYETARPEDGVVTPHGAGRADAVAVLLHDVIPYLFPEIYQPDAATRSFYRRREHLVRSADLVLTNSHSTRRDGISMFDLDPDRVVTVGSGASELFRPSESPDEPGEVLRRARLEPRGPFVLTVSGYEPRKDPTILISAFAALPRTLRDGHQLLIVCDLPPAAESQWRAHAAQSGLATDQLVLTDRVSDTALRALYQACALFVFSSRYEGFGLPVLEAARCGAPVITSDNSALPEVLECPDSTFATGDVDALAAAIERALTDDEYRAVLRAAASRAAPRHTWDAVAERTVAAYNDLWDSRAAPDSVPASPRMMRHRTAVCTPLPPSRSGVATFTGLVLPHLALRHEVDCFRDGPAVIDVDRDRAFRCFAARAFRDHFSPGSYDSLLYVLGNSDYHRHALRHAMAAPGVVWLHDASLVGLYLTVAGMYLPGRDPLGTDLGAARASMRAALVRCLGPDAPDLGDAWAVPDEYARRGITMTEEVSRAASAIIVSTAAAAATVRVVAPDTPVHVIPLPVPARRREADDPDGSDPALVVSLGWVDPIKRPEVVVEAFAEATRSTPARLAFVGECAPFLAEGIRARARELGVEDRVEITGFVESPDEYHEWLARASCVVQLRSRSHGESSGVVVDAIAAGVPVITSVASAKELPDGVVEYVEPDAPVETIAARLVALLGGTDRRGRMVEAGAEYARSWTAADVAAAVADVLVASAS